MEDEDKNQEAAAKEDEGQEDDEAEERDEGSFVIRQPVEVEEAFEKFEPLVMSVSSDTVIRPPDAYANMGIPKSCKPVFFTYECSEETKYLASEKKRSIFAELFITNSLLGPLSELCVKAWINANMPIEMIPNLSEHPEYLAFAYDFLPLDMPLEKSLSIDDESYWKRLVLSRHPNKSLAFRNDVIWKNLGVSLLLAERVEQAAVEYWLNEDMEELSQMIRDNVTEMTLRKLQTQMDRTFDEYYENDEYENMGSIVESDDEFLDEEEQRQQQKNKVGAGFDDPNNVSDLDNEGIQENDSEEEEGQEEENKETVVEEEEPPPPPPPKKKKKKKKKGLSIIDIPVEDSDSEIMAQEIEDEKVDGRNIEKLVEKLRNFNYPTAICHHIDLSFIQYFDQIEEFNLSFAGDGHIFDFHEKHLKFSYKDMENLAYGIRFLPNLKIFTLTRSRMDKTKLKILVKALMYSPSLEVVDFGVDNLDDKCGRWFYELIKNSTSLRRLELQSNKLGSNAMHWLSAAFARHQGSIIEYLGLARNPIGDSGLKYLAKGLVGTPHVEELNLSGISCSQYGLGILAEQLVEKHEYLKTLYLTAVSIGQNAANKLIKAFIKCFNLMKIEVTCCGLSYVDELDIAIIEKRNSIFNENLPDPDADLASLKDWFSRVKHPLLLQVIADFELFLFNMENRPPEFIYETPEPSLFSEGAGSVEMVPCEHEESEEEGENFCADSESISFPYPEIPKIAHVMNFDNLNQEEFLKLSSTGSHGNRFNYFRAMERRHKKINRIRKVEHTHHERLSINDD